jgi:hypothetical protein
MNMSKDICGDLCEKGAVCAESGACICSKEPVKPRIELGIIFKRMKTNNAY